MRARCWSIIVSGIVSGIASAISLASAPALADPAASVHAAVARFRAAAGLSAVSLDASLSAGCAKHADYLKRNEGKAAVAGLAAHQEQPDLPGATAEGADCGKNADLFVGVADLEHAVDNFMAGIYHRRPVLDPALVKIGVGIAPLADGTFVLALRFGQTDGSGVWPIEYPADHQADVPREYGNEIPNPVPGGGAAGYPITLQFPPFDKVSGVHAKLVDGKGHAVAVYLSDPEHPATSFPQSGVVSVIPQQPLAPATTYAVAIDATWKGKRASWKWSFTTLALRAVDAADRHALEGALGVPSLVRGKVTHAGTISGATFLQLAGGDPMVSVIVPTAVWQQIRGEPASFEGKTVEVDATPQLVAHKYLNLPIATAKQLRVVK